MLTSFKPNESGNDRLMRLNKFNENPGNFITVDYRRRKGEGSKNAYSKVRG